MGGRRPGGCANWTPSTLSSVDTSEWDVIVPAAIAGKSIQFARGLISHFITASGAVPTVASVRHA